MIKGGEDLRLEQKALLRKAIDRGHMSFLVSEGESQRFWVIKQELNWIKRAKEDNRKKATKQKNDRI